MPPTTSLVALAALFVATLVGPAAAAATAAYVPPLPMVGHCNVQTAQLHDTTWLGMYCNNHNVAAFDYDWAWINLAWCVANRNGRLVGGGARHGHGGSGGGGYDATCTGCAASLVPASPGALRRPGAVYTDGHTVDLQCHCRDTTGQVVDSSIDLNNILVDVDGYLGCYGRRGNKTQVGPLPPNIKHSN